MNTPNDPMSRYPQAAYLNAHYRQLEGFTGPMSELAPSSTSEALSPEKTAVLTTADVYKESGFCARAAKHDDDRNTPQDSWADALMTIVVMFVVLVSSSMLLGIAASQITSATQQLTHSAIQQRSLHSQ